MQFYVSVCVIQNLCRANVGNGLAGSCGKFFSQSFGWHKQTLLNRIYGLAVFKKYAQFCIVKLGI